MAAGDCWSYDVEREALAYSENLSLGGHSDWRLPNINELQSLVDYTTYNPSIDIAAFPDTMTTDDYSSLPQVYDFMFGWEPDAQAAHYWSSTTKHFPNTTAWTMDFISSYVSSRSKQKVSQVRAVRGSKNEAPIADANSDQTAILGEYVAFDGSGSHDPNGNIVSYKWEFDDGVIGSSVTTLHYYELPGQYEVTLTVTDDAGETGTDITIITVQTPTEATNELIFDTEDLNLPRGTKNSLTSKLKSSMNSLDNGRENAAINKLEAFINQIETLRGKKLTNEEADLSILAAQRIIDNI